MKGNYPNGFVPHVEPMQQGEPRVRPELSNVGICADCGSGIRRKGAKGGEVPGPCMWCHKPRSS